MKIKCSHNELLETIIDNNLYWVLLNCESSSGGKFYEAIYCKKTESFFTNFGKSSSRKSKLNIDDISLSSSSYSKTEFYKKIAEKYKKGYELIEFETLDSKKENTSKKEDKKKNFSYEEAMSELFD